MYQLIYMSYAPRPLRDGELDAILAASRSHNRAFGITGMLLFAGGSFFQVIEGPQPMVYATYDRIFFDERHRRLKILLEGEVPARAFSGWSMGFHRATGSTQTSQSYFDLSAESLLAAIPPGVSKDAARILRSFSQTKLAGPGQDSLVSTP